jgi:hypothetical protein
MAATKKKRVNKFTVRENSKRDNSPKWDGHEAWTAEQFGKHFHDAQKYYSLEKTAKDLKVKVIDWMGHNDYPRATIVAFKKTKDWRTNTSVGGIAANLLKGMPASHPGWNNGKSTVEWLREQIALIIEDGANDKAEESDDTVVDTGPVLNIQERIREQAGTMTDEIEGAIDSFITNPDAFNPGDIKITNMLRGKGAKGPQARYIKGFYEFNHNTLSLIVSGEADAELKEGYKHLSKKNTKKLLEFYENIQTACDQIIAEAKVLKKPRKKKVKPAEELVKKIKFKMSDDKLGITSYPPAQIIGAQGVVVLNTKNRKIGYYIATNIEGLNVKGASIVGYTGKSLQKTLRKPAEQVKEFKDQNTQKRFETWFEKIKTTETELNGRLNQDTIILKVFK